MQKIIHIITGEQIPGAPCHDSQIYTVMPGIFGSSIRNLLMSHF